MDLIKMTGLSAGTFLCAILFFARDEKEFKKKDLVECAPVVQHIDTSGCDPKLWDHVYDPTRLKVMDQCRTVTGIIEESNADADGDQHMLLKLDVPYENMLTKVNRKKKNGYLVIEAVCINKITKAKVGDACKGYVNHVQLPRVGDRVKVTGSYVLDTHNGWAEIHPITRVVRY